MPTEIERQALFKAMLPELDQEFLKLLKAELRDTLLEEVMPEAEARAKAALETELERRTEALEDAYATKRQHIQADADSELETTLARERAKLAREAEGELESARDEARDAQARQAAAETALVATWKQLLPDGTRTYLYDTGLRELDLTVLNPLLARAGQVQIAYQKATSSQRLVKLKVDAAHFEAAARFWLDAAEPTPTRSPHGLVDPATYR